MWSIIRREVGNTGKSDSEKRYLGKRDSGNEIRENVTQGNEILEQCYFGRPLKKKDHDRRGLP
jgi:hypothetical protein